MKFFTRALSLPPTNLIFSFRSSEQKQVSLLRRQWPPHAVQGMQRMSYSANAGKVIPINLFSNASLVAVAMLVDIISSHKIPEQATYG